MTTYLLLALHEDGRSEARTLHAPIMQWIYAGTQQIGVAALPRLDPSASGNDRGQFSTYQTVGFSIDVVKLPETPPCVNCGKPRDFWYGGVLQTVCEACTDAATVLRPRDRQ